MARLHDAVVVGGSELAGEQEEGLVFQIGERDGIRIGEAVAFAELRSERFAAQDFVGDARHRLGMQGEPDVELSGQDPAGDLGAEQLAGDDGHVRVVVLDCCEDRPESLEARQRGVAKAYGAGDALTGKARALGGALERCEREWCFLQERLPGGGELDLAAGAREQVGAEGALELADLVAQRRLGDVEARGGTAEVELLCDGEEVPDKARLKIDSPRLSMACGTGLGQEPSSGFTVVERTDSFGEEHTMPSDAAVEANIEIAREYTRRVFNAHNPDLAAEFVTPDVKWHGGTLGTVEGVENLVGLLRGFIGALPDLNAQEQDIVAAGDTVALRFVVEATHQGDLLGIAPTGRKVRWDAVDVYRLRDGKISEEWAADDMAAILHQVGAYTPPWLS
jgi:predicted ester cyclase